MKWSAYYIKAEFRFTDLDSSKQLNLLMILHNNASQ